MKYQSPQLRTSLAAEYALGTLRGRARARLEKLLRRDTAWQEEVTFWNDRLADLASTLPPQAPRDVVWAALEREIANDQALAQRKVVPLRSKMSAAANSPYWKIATLAASVAALALGMGLVQSRQRLEEANLALQDSQQKVAQAEAQVDAARAQVAAADQRLQGLTAQIASIKPAEPMPYVAVFAPSDGGTDMRWAVSLHPNKKVMRVILTGSKPMPMGEGAKALELWMLAKDGPKSLGVLPMTGINAPQDLPLPEMPDDEMGITFTLAVSEEPEGGSPTGAPTGKVLGAFPAAKAI